MFQTPFGKANDVGQSSNCHSDLYLTLSHATINRGLMKFSYLWCERVSKKQPGVETRQDSQVFFNEMNLRSFWYKIKIVRENLLVE